MKYNVSEKTLNDYVKASREILEKDINAYFSDKFLLILEDYLYSFCFFKEHLILLEIKNEEIIGFYKIMLEDFWDYKTINWVTENLLMKILEIERYFNLKVEKFFRQIEKDLYLEFIVVESNIIKWNRYNIEIELKIEDIKEFISFLRKVAV